MYRQSQGVHNNKRNSYGRGGLLISSCLYENDVIRLGGDDGSEDGCIVTNVASIVAHCSYGSNREKIG